MGMEWSKREVKNDWGPLFFSSFTLPSFICQQEVRCMHQCNEEAFSSLTSLSLSPVSLTLGISALYQISLLAFLQLPPSLHHIQYEKLLACSECFVTAQCCYHTPRVWKDNQGHMLNYDLKKKNWVYQITIWNSRVTNMEDLNKDGGLIICGFK